MNESRNGWNKDTRIQVGNTKCYGVQYSRNSKQLHNRNTMLAPKHLHKIVGTHDLCGQHSLCHPNSFTIPFRRVLTASPFRFFDASKLNVRRKGHRVVHSICLDVCCCRFKKADGGKLYAL